MTQSGKWIEGIGPDCEVAEAARISLDARLSAVARWLPAAAYCAELDVEHVHRLRVSTRRAMAALKLYRDWLPSGPSGWIKKRLKKIRRAAGEARDLDVLAERMRHELGEGAENLLVEIATRRAEVQPAIERIADRCRHKNRFPRKVGKLLKGIRKRGNASDHDGPLSFHGWARGQLNELAQAFFAAMPTGDSDMAALHQFRIRGKALRYAIELVAPAFGAELRDEQYPIIEKLQERLGRINDHVAAAERLRAWKSDDEAKAKLFQELARQETEQLDEELREFRAWWTPDRADSLQRGLLDETNRHSRTILVR